MKRFEASYQRNLRSGQNELWQKGSSTLAIN